MGGCAAREVPRVRPSIIRTAVNAFPKIPDQENLESYYLFWLDSTVRSPEFIETQDELRSIINQVKIFESNIECQKEFEKITNGKIFFIVTCIQASSLLSIIHDHKQLDSIYIYHSGDNIDMERITSQYKKVFGFIFNLDNFEKYFVC
jgi:hypothetical protein